MNPPSFIPPEVSMELGWYVYLYIDPRTDSPFYVGKGCGERALHHLRDPGDTRKVELIRALRDAGLQPRIELLRSGLSEDQARLVEASVIDLLGLGVLTNLIRGHHSGSLGRTTLQELIDAHSAPLCEIREPSILFRINELYRSNMSPLELEEATRGFWKVGRDLSLRARAAQFAFAVYRGIVREVYRIERWHPAGTLTYQTRDPAPYRNKDRWEFSGSIAIDLRQRYLGYSVRHLFKQGAVSPARYLNC